MVEFTTIVCIVYVVCTLAYFAYSTYAFRVKQENTDSGTDELWYNLVAVVYLLSGVATFFFLNNLGLTALQTLGLFVVSSIVSTQVGASAISVIFNCLGDKGGGPQPKPCAHIGAHIEPILHTLILGAGSMTGLAALLVFLTGVAWGAPWWVNGVLAAILGPSLFAITLAGLLRIMPLLYQPPPQKMR